VSCIYTKFVKRQTWYDIWKIISWNTLVHVAVWIIKIPEFQFVKTWHRSLPENASFPCRGHRVRTVYVNWVWLFTTTASRQLPWWASPRTMADIDYRTCFDKLEKLAYNISFKYANKIRVYVWIVNDTCFQWLLSYLW